MKRVIMFTETQKMLDWIDTQKKPLMLHEIIFVYEVDE
jgi:hypothetical protein